MPTLAEQHDYVPSAPIQENRWDAATQTVITGFSYPVYDRLTKQNVKVFVPADVHTVEGVDTYIMAALAVPRQVLGV